MKKDALKEAVTDTALAASINVPLNYVLISLAFSMELSALQSTFLFTTVFTLIAVTRKYFVRIHFERRSLRGC